MVPDCSIDCSGHFGAKNRLGDDTVGVMVNRNNKFVSLPVPRGIDDEYGISVVQCKEDI